MIKDSEIIQEKIKVLSAEMKNTQEMLNKIQVNNKESIELLLKKNQELMIENAYLKGRLGEGS